MSLRIGRSARARSDGLARIPAQELERLIDVGEGGLGSADRLLLAQTIRAQLGDAGAELDQLLLERICGLGKTLDRLRHAQDELKALLARYQTGPWRPAVFVDLLPGLEPPRVLVMSGGARRVVGLASELEASSLASGEEVYLDDEQSLVVARSPFGTPPSADTATLERTLHDGRLILRWRDELVVAAAAAAVSAATLQAGDLIRWDRDTGMAFERLEEQVGRRFLLEEVPDVARERVGGQDENLERLIDALTSTLVDPARAQRYGLGARQSILMVGPPGGGKTLLTRIAAAEVHRLTGRRCRLAVVKPGEWESPWVGESQRNIRECFKALREAASDGFALLFLDEIEAVGRIRGGGIGHHDDKFLAALLAEIDGFSEREGVAIVAATNRKDLIDPALLERLSDVELHVGRPDMEGARRILEIHLAETVPFAVAGSGVVDPRGALIDLAASRLYSPNAGNELCRLRFRDGTSRVIAARELVSGRILEQLCRTARASAFHRELRGGEAGVSAGDVENAVAWTMDKLATTLTPRNCRAYLSDLPQDLDMVSVEPIRRRVPRSQEYLTAA